MNKRIYILILMTMVLCLQLCGCSKTQITAPDSLIVENFNFTYYDMYFNDYKYTIEHNPDPVNHKDLVTFTISAKGDYGFLTQSTDYFCQYYPEYDMWDIEGEDVPNRTVEINKEKVIDTYSWTGTTNYQNSDRNRNFTYYIDVLDLDLEHETIKLSYSIDFEDNYFTDITGKNMIHSCYLGGFENTSEAYTITISTYGTEYEDGLFFYLSPQFGISTDLYTTQQNHL